MKFRWLAIGEAGDSKAVNLERLGMLMPKFVGPSGIEYFSPNFNQSLATLIISDMWKSGRRVSLLKPGNQPSKEYLIVQ